MRKRATILLVDDNLADVKLTLRAIGQKHDADVEVVRDGQEALDYLFSRGRFSDGKTGNLKLILLDLKLPKVNGFEFLKIAKADTATRSIPIVVLTSSNQERDIRESYLLGANSYIQKPLNFGDFSRVVDMVWQYWLRTNQHVSRVSDSTVYPRDKQDSEGQTGGDE